MSYEQFPIVEKDLDELELDLENYRIPTRRADEASALRYLFASEDVMDAARSILRNGYFDNEVPVVVPPATVQQPATDGTPESSEKEGASAGPIGTTPFIILEGNRRVSALKALADPTIVPSHEAELRGLLKRYAVEARNLPTRIRVLVAPDRATAAPHVARLHSGLTKRAWTRDQQATYYYSLLDDDTSAADVRAQYPDAGVARYFRMAVMRRFLAAVPFEDHSLRQYARGDELRMSVFEYAYRDKDIAGMIGVHFNSDGFLLPDARNPELIGSQRSGPDLRALEYLTNEFRASRLNTRSDAFKKAHPARAELLRRLGAVRTDRAGEPIDTSVLPPLRPARPTQQQLPDPEVQRPVPSSAYADDEKRTEQSAASVDEGEFWAPTESTHPVAEASPPATVRGPNHPDSRPFLDLTAIGYDAAPLNLKLRYHELRRLNIQDTPIATAIFMRSILESTIKIHFEGSATPAAGELKAVIAIVDAAYGRDRSLKSVIGKIRSGDIDDPGSVTWFNMLAHGADEIVDAEAVRRAWTVVNPLLRRLLIQPRRLDDPQVGAH